MDLEHKKFLAKKIMTANSKKNITTRNKKITRKIKIVKLIISRIPKSLLKQQKRCVYAKKYMKKQSKNQFVFMDLSLHPEVGKLRSPSKT